MTHHENTVESTGHGTDHGTEPSAEHVAAINSSIRYTMYSVFRVIRELPADRAELVAQTEGFFTNLEQQGVVVVRGIYDVAGLRADADLMIWWHAESIDDLQAAYHAFLQTPLGRHLDPVWSNAGIHRPAEFNKGHVPAFLAGDTALKYMCVYPFVRSYDWYLLPEDERRTMLKDHGMAARDYKDVRANTVAAFALGDYEWLLAFEADELHRIVDLMRDLRAVDARLHVREEIPFYTGPQVSIARFVEQLR